MFGYYPPYPLKIDESKKSIAKNKQNIIGNSLLSIFWGAFTTGLSIGGIYSAVTSYGFGPDDPSLLECVLGGFIWTAGWQFNNYYFNKEFAKNSGGERNAIDAKKRYKTAIKKHDIQTVNELRDTYSYLENWGERYCSSDRQLELHFQDNYQSFY
ncbi:MAG: hypothetical protein ACQESE_04570 [Nanobdellota archaeon]